MTTQDLMTLIGINLAMLTVFSGFIYWAVNRIDTDVKGVREDMKGLSSRLDGHATRIDQLYRMFVDLLKEGRK